MTPVATGDAGPELAALIAACLREVPDFPKPGIAFKDIMGLLAEAAAFADVTRALAAFALGVGPVDLVAGVEARGFLLAGALAYELGCGLVPVRKAGKLPPPTLRRAYALEYGTAEIEVPASLLPDKRVLIVDDVLATGGTLRAAAALVTQAGATVVGLAAILELGFLAGRDSLGHEVPIHTLLQV